VSPLDWISGDGGQKIKRIKRSGLQTSQLGPIQAGFIGQVGARERKVGDLRERHRPRFTIFRSPLEWGDFANLLGERNRAFSDGRVLAGGVLPPGPYVATKILPRDRFE